MWALSGFADEISPDLKSQCETLKDLGIAYIESRIHTPALACATMCARAYNWRDPPHQTAGA